MKKTCYFFCYMALLFPLISHSMTENVTVIKKPSKEIYDGSSEANRMNKHFSVYANLLGIGPSLVPNTGMGVGYHISSDQLLLVELRGGRGPQLRSYRTRNGLAETSGETKSNLNSLGVHYKQFVSNSFYFRTGADFTQVSYEYNFDYAGSDNDFKSEFKGQSISGNFSIGNQWQWENFTLGCDWIGYSQTLSSKYDKNSITGDPAELDRENFNDDKKLYLEGSSVVAVRFYLGATF